MCIRDSRHDVLVDGGVDIVRESPHCRGARRIGDNALDAADARATIGACGAKRLLVAAADSRFPFTKPRKGVCETNRGTKVVPVLRHRLDAWIGTAGSNKLNDGERARIASRDG